MATFACYSKPIEPELHNNVLALKERISRGETPPHEFLTYMHEVSLMAHSNEAVKIASFAPHLFEQFSNTEKLSAQIEDSAMRDEKNSAERAGSAKKQDKSKQAAIGQPYEQFAEEMPIIAEEILFSQQLEETSAAARSYMLQQYTISAFNNDEEEITSELLMLATRAISIFWRGYSELENLEFAACHAVIRRIITLIERNDVNLHLLARERAEAFVCGRKTSEIIKELLPDKAKSACANAFNLLAVFISAFQYMYKNATRKPTFLLFNVCFVLCQLRNTIFALENIGVSLEQGFSQILLQLCILLTEDLADIKLAYLDQAQKYERLGDAVVEHVETEELLAIAQELLAAKGIPKDTDSVNQAYHVWIEGIQESVLQYVELNLRVYELTAAAVTYSSCTAIDSTIGTPISHQTDNLELSFPASYDALAFFCKIADKFQQKDGNEAYLDFFAAVPIAVEMVNPENTHFGYLNLERTGNASSVIEDMLSAYGKTFEVFEDVRKTILQSACIFSVGGSKTMFYEYVLSVGRFVATALFEFAAQQDKKAVDKKGAEAQSPDMLSEGLSNVIAQLLASGQEFSALSLFSGVKANAFLVVMFELALHQLIEAIKTEFSEQITYELVEIQLNVFQECHKLLYLTGPMEKEPKEKVQQETRSIGETILQNSPFEITDTLLQLLSDHAVDAMLWNRGERVQSAGCHEFFADSKLVIEQLDCVGITSQRCQINLSILELLVKQDNVESRLSDILAKTVTVLKLVLEDSTFSNEQKCRYEFDFLIRAALLVKNFLPLQTLNVSDQMLELCSIDSGSYVEEVVEVVEPEYGTLRERMLMESLEKSILRESIARSVCNVEKRTEQLSTMIPFARWRACFVYTLLECLTREHRYEILCDLATQWKDVVYIEQNATLLFLVVKAMIQVGRVDQISELLQSASLSVTENQDLLCSVMRETIGVRSSASLIEISELQRYCVQRVRELLQDEPNKETSEQVAFVELVNRCNQRDYTYCQDHIKAFSQQPGALPVLLEIAARARVADETTLELIEQYDPDISAEELPVQFAEQISISNAPLRVSAGASDNAILAHISVTEQFVNAESELSVALFTSLLRKILAETISFAIFSRVCALTGNYVSMTMRRFHNDAACLLLINASKWITRTALQQCRASVDAFIAESSEFAFESREIQENMLEFGFVLTFHGLHERAQLIFESDIGSPALEKYITNQYVSRFYKQDNAELAARNQQIYVALCHIPKLTLKALICFNIGQFRQAYEIAAQLYPFLNTIQYRLASRIVSTELYAETYYQNQWLLIGSRQTLALALKLLIASALLSGAEMERYCELVNALQNTELRDAARQCKILLAASAVYSAPQKNVGSEVLDQRQWQYAVATNFIYTHYRTTGAIAYEQIAQMHVYQQASYISEMPSADAITQLYTTLKELASWEYDEETSAVAFTVLFAAPNYVFGEIIKNQQLPKIEALQLLVPARRLMICRFLLTQMLSTSEDRSLHVAMAQINVVLAAFAQCDATQLADVYFEGETRQDALITRYLTTLSSTNEPKFVEWLENPFSYNVSVPDLLWQVTESLRNSDLCKVPSVDKSVAGLVDVLCGLESAFVVANDVVSYERSIKVRVPVQQETTKAKEEPQFATAEYTPQMYASKVVLQIIAESAFILLRELMENAIKVDRSLFDLEDAQEACYVTVARALLGLPTTPVEIVKESLASAVAGSELKLLREFVDSLKMAFLTNESDQALFSRALALLIDFRKPQIANFVGLDRAVIHAMQFVHESQFGILSEHAAENVFEQKQSLTVFTTTTPVGSTDPATTSSADVFAQFAEQETSAAKGAKKAENAESIAFTALQADELIVDWYAGQFSELEAVLRRRFGKLALIDIGMAILILPRYGIVCTPEKTVVSSELALNHAFLAEKCAAYNDNVKLQAIGRRFYHVDSHKLSTVRETVVAAEAEIGESLVQMFDEFASKCKQFSNKCDDNQDNNESCMLGGSEQLAKFAEVIGQCKQTSSSAINHLGLVHLAQIAGCATKLIVQRKPQEPIQVAQPALRLFDVLDDFIFASKNGQDFRTTACFGRVKQLLQSDDCLTAPDEIADALLQAQTAICITLHPIADFRVFERLQHSAGDNLLIISTPLEFSIKRSAEKCVNMSQVERFLSDDNFVCLQYVLRGGSRAVRANISLAQLCLLLWRVLIELLPRSSDKKKDLKKKESAALSWEECIFESAIDICDVYEALY